MGGGACLDGVDSLPDAASVIVTCVHGTWARGARWPQLEAAIADALGTCTPLTFRYFEWSGRNSVSARARAAADLRRALLQQISDTPQARLLLVGHSHGANVVLHALADRGDDVSAITHATRGIVLLSPPLLDCKVVEQPTAAANRLMLGALTIVPLLVVAASYAHTRLGVSDVTALAGLAVATFFWLMAFRPAAVRRNAEARARQMALPRLDFPGLIVQDSRDEATLALSSISAFARLARFVWARVLRLRAPLHRAEARRLHDARGFGEVALAMIETAILVPVSAWFLSRAHDAASTAQWMTLAVTLPPAMLLATAAMVIVGGSFVLLVLLPAFSFLLWPFGIGPTPAAALLKVSIERAPTPSWHLVDCRESGVSGWRHSVHEHRAALEHVARWINGAAGTAARIPACDGAAGPAAPRPTGEQGSDAS